MENEIEYFVREDFNYDLISEAAKLHVEHLSDHGFLTLFGSKFIMELYKDILKNKSGFFIFATYKKKVCGFVLGSVDSSMMFRIIMKKFPKYLKIIFPFIFRKPQIIPKLFETLFYVNKQHTRIKPELVVIITDSSHRSAGIGSHLVSLLNMEFLKRKVNQYKVTVHDVKERSNNFYLKNGFRFAATFPMYNLKWNMYIKQL